MIEKQIQITFKAYPAHHWPPTLSKAQRKFHEHARCRGFTPEEIRIFKRLGHWKGGQYTEKAPTYVQS